LPASTCGAERRVRHRLAAVLALTAALLLAPDVTPLAAQNGAPSLSAILDKATSDFFAGRITESVSGFDRAATVEPSIAPELWQRGIALYYAGRYADCRKQFESHRTVNPADVENAAWHFLCVARAETPARARAALLPVGPDDRQPMREIYRMFAGDIAPDSVLVAGVADARARFYAALYVGLYFEAIGEPRAQAYIKEAASDRYASAGGYMHRVAKVHMQVRGWKAE
jgi:lipoprotein NlpI